MISAFPTCPGGGTSRKPSENHCTGEAPLYFQSGHEAENLPAINSKGLAMHPNDTPNNRWLRETWLHCPRGPPSPWPPLSSGSSFLRYLGTWSVVPGSLILNHSLEARKVMVIGLHFSLLLFGGRLGQLAGQLEGSVTQPPELRADPHFIKPTWASSFSF